MKQYSLEAIALRPVAIPDPLIMLDKGFNAFQLRTDDIGSVLLLLADEGVTVKATYEIGQDTPASLDDELLLGETRESIGIL
jgi:hypothetical protein